jgi:hypothetical protein
MRPGQGAVDNGKGEGGCVAIHEGRRKGCAILPVWMTEKQGFTVAGQGVFASLLAEDDSREHSRSILARTSGIRVGSVYGSGSSFRSEAMFVGARG